MNRRLAKKKVKQKHFIRKYPNGLAPRQVDILYTNFNAELSRAIERAILYGDKDENGLVEIPDNFWTLENLLAD